MSAKAMRHKDWRGGRDRLRPIFDGFVEHAYIEPESVTVIPDRMRRELTVLGCSQAPYNLRLSVARMLNIPIAQVIVRPSVIGGSFGGKIESVESLAVRAGLVSLKTGRPVQYTLRGRSRSARATNVTRSILRFSWVQSGMVRSWL